MENIFKYILDTYKSIYNTKDINIDISFGNNKLSKIQIPSYSNNFFSNTKNKKIPDVIFKQWNKKEIPFLFSKNNTSAVLEFNDKVVKINYDIISSSFYFLSNWQEKVALPDDKDAHGRYSYSSSLQAKYNFLNIPVVNYYFDILNRAIELAYNIKVEKHSIWNNESFITSISHDIDKCKNGWLEDGLWNLKRFNLLTTIKLFLKKIFYKDEWFNFKYILDYEKKNNVISVFYFLVGKNKIQGKHNPDYNYNSKVFKQVFKDIMSNGSEIGIHGSFTAYDNSKRLNDELEKLKPVLTKKQKYIGNRFHFLKFDVNKTFDVINSSELHYDMSLGFAEKIGFRNGICHPFKPYNFNLNKAYQFIEFPLIVMDSTLLSKPYMNLKSSNEVINELESVINEVYKYNGCFTLLWHNTSYTKYKYKEWRSVFLDIIKLCKSYNSKFCTPNQILNQWETN